MFAPPGASAVALWNLGVAVEVREERCMLRLRKHAAEQCVNNPASKMRLSAGVARGKQPGVTEQHVVQFMHDEHQKGALGRGGSALSTNCGLDEEARHRRAFDCGGLHFIGLSSMSRAGGAAPGGRSSRSWKCIQNPFSNRNGGH